MGRFGVVRVSEGGGRLNTSSVFGFIIRGKKMEIFFVLLLVSLSGITAQEDEPLILTKYLEEGDIEGGQKAARVEPLIEGVESYSGYFTVDPDYESNLFFWYFPTTDVKAPVVVWLQGGPGASSMFGLFYENGPMTIEGGRLGRREYSWSKVAHVIFVDNPAGTGFSFTNSVEGFVTDETQVGEGLYSFTKQFLTLFPHLRDNDLYITGESYGGKYVPAMAYTIHNENPTSDLKINLKGVAIGDGFSDPINMLGYGDYLFQIGLIDESTRNTFQIAEDSIRNLILQGRYKEANYKSDLIISGGKGSLMANVTGMNSYYNYYDPSDDGSDDDMTALFKQSWVSQRIHVGNVKFGSDSNSVAQHLSGDIMKSIVPWFTTVADNYRVILYNGQFDIIVAYPLTVNFLRNFEWCGFEEYLSTPRKIWMVDGELAGYTRTVKPNNCTGSLTEILVRNAGHMVPRDQPKWAFDIIARLVHNKDF